MEGKEIAEFLLSRGSNGFGLQLKGGADQPEYLHDHGIFITGVKITSNDPGMSVGKGDKVLEINQMSVEDLTHSEVLDLFKKSGHEVKVKVWRGAQKSLSAQSIEDKRPVDNEDLSLIIKKELGMPMPRRPIHVQDNVQAPGRFLEDEEHALPIRRENWEEEDDEESSEHEDDDEEKDDERNSEEVFSQLAAEHRIANRVTDDQNLPPTVAVLHGKNGEKVYLIGTAHFSKESCADVRRVIDQVRPDYVMIELCRSRTDLLINDEETLSKLAGEVSVQSVLAQIRQKGFMSGLMTFLLLHMSAHITKQLGMAPGSEFRAAWQEARTISGCRVLFGDRPVEVTLRRAFGVLSVWQKLKFALHVLKDLGPIKPEDIEKLKEKDMLEQALGEMMEEFPQMTNVFLNERDVYLAKSLQLAVANEVWTESAVSPTVVVGVVGLGHAAGIKKNFDRDIPRKELEGLLEVPKPSSTLKIMKWCFRLSLLFTVGYGMWHLSGLVKPLFSLVLPQNSIQEQEL